MIAMIVAAGGMHHAEAAVEHSAIEWLVVLIAAMVLLWTLGLAIRYTIFPGESDATHIKHRILLDEPESLPRPRPR